MHEYQHEGGHADDLDRGRNHTRHGDRLRMPCQHENTNRGGDCDQQPRQEQFERLVGVAEHGNVAQGKGNVEAGTDTERDAQLRQHLRQMVALKGALALGLAKRRR